MKINIKIKYINKEFIDGVPISDWQMQFELKIREKVRLLSYKSKKIIKKLQLYK